MRHDALQTVPVLCVVSDELKFRRIWAIRIKAQNSTLLQ